MKRLCEILKEIIEATNSQTTINKQEIELLRKAIGLGFSGNGIELQDVPNSEELSIFDKYVGTQPNFDLTQAATNPQMASYTGDALDEIINGAFDILDNRYFQELKKHFTPQEIVSLRNIKKKFDAVLTKANNDRRERTGAAI